ncbi:hypothetical protein GCM10009760_21660 [Kitasatospora kazusensis]|uniref:Uncharacterized protein n=1 Tax=Kitasatospora kazusensis TaxID=407974 RepID=A0ABN2ZBE8_9ACTN
MRLRTSLACTVAALSFAAMAGGGAGAAQAAAPRTALAPVGSAVPAGAGLRASAVRAQLTLAQLTDKVLAQVKAQYPTVTTLMLASGEAPGGPTTDMAQVTQWEFVVNNTAQGPVGSVDVEADLGGTVSGITTHAQRWGGVLPITLPITMDPTEAYGIVATAGHPGPYQFVALVKPLVAGPHLQYHFSNVRGGNQGYSVNTDEPHTVSPIGGGATLGAPEPPEC